MRGLSRFVLALTILFDGSCKDEEECARDSSYFGGTSTMYDGALRVAIRFPCDTSKLATSEDLPASILTANDRLFSSADRDQLPAGRRRIAIRRGSGPAGRDAES